MRVTRPILFLGIAATVCGVAAAQDGEDAEHAAQRGPHGGALSAVGAHQYEVEFKREGVRLYVYDEQGAPIDARRARGAVMMTVQGNPHEYRYDLYPENARGAVPHSLYLPLDLSRIPDGAMETSFVLYGLSGIGRQGDRFQQTFHVTLSAEEQAIARQRTCPVSGKVLGSMGRPVKVRVGDRDVYVCCAGCTGAVESDPERYLAILDAANPLPAQATEADAEAIAAQRTCPVMDEELGSMGVPWKVYVEGRPVFLCCRGCIKFIERDPARYLAKLPAPEPARATEADATAIAEQRLCPVTEEPLSSMGGPWKVYANGQPIFVCCRGCIRRVQENPELYLGKAQQFSVGRARLSR